MADHITDISPASFTTFGTLLRFLRRRARLTQRELSIEVGYNFAQISRLEADQRFPDPSVVAATFVPALGLKDEPTWAARLVELAETARNQSDEQIFTNTVARTPSVPQIEQQHTPEEIAVSPIPLLVTKFYLPRTRADRVARPRLLSRLDDVLDAPLTIISAPAGFGKTTLLAEWLAQGTEGRRQGLEKESSGPPSLTPTLYTVAWLSLDNGDNDPTMFLRYLIAAFRTSLPTIGTAALALAQSSQPPPLEVQVRVLLNDLAALPDQIVLVLDDYHLITTPAIHTALREFLDHVPPTLHVVIATRADPPLPLARLRARGQVVELRAADLRFSLDEATTFLTEVMHIPLSAADVAALETRTEGWVAGLQLAALAMRDRGDIAAFISAFTGSNRFVVDYLAAEVFERQPAHMQTFLLQTSILDRLCGPLCDAVLEVGDQDLGISISSLSPEPQPLNLDSYSQLMLDQLEQANLFLIPLDDERHWYRYHHLFGEVLRERLTRAATAEHVAVLHRRASAWFEAQDLIEEALDHALAAGEPHVAIDLIEQRAEGLIMSSEVARLQRWIDRLPQELVYQHHRLAHASAAALATVGAVAKIEPLLQAAERAYSHTNRAAPMQVSAETDTDDRDWLDDLAGYPETIRSIVARTEGDLPRSVTLAQAALSHLPERYLFLRAVAAWNIGMGYYFNGEVPAAAAVFHEVWNHHQSTGYLYVLMVLGASLAQTRVIQGQLRESTGIYRRALSYATAAGANLPSVGLIHTGLGDVLREMNDLATATQHLNEGLRLGKLFGSADLLITGYTTLARVKLAQGEHMAVDEALAQAQQLVPNTVFSPASSQPARLWLAQGNLASAEAWATSIGIDVDAPPNYLYETQQVILARVLLARGAYAEAVALLERLIRVTTAGKRYGTLAELLALKALAHHGLSEQHAALEALEQSLGYAAEEGYVRLFIDEGTPMVELLNSLRGQPAAVQYRPYIETLLAAFPRVDPHTFGHENLPTT